MAALLALSLAANGAALANPNSTQETAPTTSPASGEWIIVTNGGNTIQLRLYTNACPDAPHVFNTFELQAHGANLLRSATGALASQGQSLSAPDHPLHHILVNGEGPSLACSNGMTLMEQASGPDWRYISLDGKEAYRGRLEVFQRALLVVDPDLIVIYDRVVAAKPIEYQMLLHPPASTRVDTDWGDLLLDLPQASMIIHSPGRKRDPRPWTQLASPADALLPATATMVLGPTNRVSQLHVLTVFAISPTGQPADYNFKLLESPAAIGAQIQRQGLPTLVAFRTDAGTENPSLMGFAFSGPVGVYVFKPKTGKSSGN
jgi:hypothetical protein